MRIMLLLEEHHSALMLTVHESSVSDLSSWHNVPNSDMLPGVCDYLASLAGFCPEVAA